MTRMLIVLFMSYVTDNGNGYLEATTSYGEDGSHFVNVGTPDNPGGGNTDSGDNGGEDGPLEALAKTSDTWLPYLFAVIALIAASVTGFAAYRIRKPSGRR